MEMDLEARGTHGDGCQCNTVYRQPVFCSVAGRRAGVRVVGVRVVGVRVVGVRVVGVRVAGGRWWV